jgi:hypothetical protein
MSISKIKKEYRIKNLFSLLIVFVLLAVVSLVSRSFKNNSASNSENLFSVANADVPTTPGGVGEGVGGGTDGGACDGGGCSSGDGGGSGGGSSGGE